MISKHLYIFLALVLFSGCASLVNRDYSKIDFSKGVNKEEAITIARKYCFDHRDIGCGGFTGVVDGDATHFYSGKWRVSFYRVLIVTFIEIDKKSGQVVGYEYDGM